MSTQIKNKIPKLLLDTHVWIWLETNKTKEITSKFVDYFVECQKKSRILLSPISFWEIGMLVQKERLRLNIDCLEWVQQAINVENLRVVPITPQIAIESSRLPGSIHGDPADRLLLATTLNQKAVFATADEKLIAYCKLHHIPYINPRSFNKK